MEIINLTPHPITIIQKNNKVSIPPSGEIARVKTNTIIYGYVLFEDMRIPLTKTNFGNVENLPDPKDDVIYIVSALVAQRVPNREDVYIPNESVRDDNGRIIGCKSLGRI